MYIHERADWPHLTWDHALLAVPLAEVRGQQGRLLGRMAALGFPQREEATLETLTQDAITSSAIEGERLDTEQVRSSVARRLGIDIGGSPHIDRQVEGIVDITFDATRKYARLLDADRLFAWHAALFPAGRSGLARITVGAWRAAGSGPMQIVSGPVGREKVHYEAPAPDRVPGEMARFLAWIEDATGDDPVIKAALAHFWFVTIHPFEDGNGRIARALTDLLLARGEGSPQRFYSMSAQIRRERGAYYRVLEVCQRGPTDVTPWIAWFLDCLGRAIATSDETLAAVLQKAHFWEVHAHMPLSDRQRLLLNRLLDGFSGKLTSAKWAKIAGVSQDTAQRDINDLLERRLLIRSAAGGRSTSYELASLE